MNTYNTVAAEVQIADNAAVAAPAHIMFFLGSEDRGRD